MMRTIIPAIAIVIALCLMTQTHLSEWQFDRGARERLLRAARASAERAPTTQPATQPIGIDEPGPPGELPARVERSR